MEYLELKRNVKDKVKIYKEKESFETDAYWNSEKTKVLNALAREGWEVVGYAKDSILMVKENKGI